LRRLARIGVDFRASVRAFQGEKLDRNLKLVEKLRQVAEAKGVTVAQNRIAWVRERGGGYSRLWWALGTRERLSESIGALDFSTTG